MSKKLDKPTFAAIKRGIFWMSKERTARKYKVSLKTVVQAKNSRTYADYREQCKAQHPPRTEPTLAEIIKFAHMYAFADEQIDRQGAYVQPSAKQAATDLVQWHDEFNIWKRGQK